MSEIQLNCLKTVHHTKFKKVWSPSPSRNAHMAVLISISLTLRQTPAYTAKPWIQGWCIMQCACLWLSCWVLIAPTHGGMARLSWPGWLHGYIPWWFNHLPTVTHPSTVTGPKVISLIEHEVLTTTSRHHNTHCVTQQVSINKLIVSKSNCRL